MFILEHLSGFSFKESFNDLLETIKDGLST